MTLRSRTRSICTVALFAAVGPLVVGCDSIAPTALDASAELHPPAFAHENDLSASTTLGTTSSFGVLAATTVTCTAASAIEGSVGVSPGSAITGFNPDCTLTGTLHSNDGVAVQAQHDAAEAFATLSEATCDVTYGAVQQLHGLTLTPGVHCFPSSANLQVDAPGIRKLHLQDRQHPGHDGGSEILLTDRATCDDIFWLVDSSGTLADSVVGNVLASASVGMDPGASLSGRAIALGGAVTMSGQNPVSDCGGTTAPEPGGKNP